MTLLPFPQAKSALACVFVVSAASIWGLACAPPVRAQEAPKKKESPAPAVTGKGAETGGRQSARMFVSGHSLTPDVMSNDIVAIARGFGLGASFQQQLVLGSPIRVRVKGMDTNAPGYPGYRIGENRAGLRDLDVLAELRAPRAAEGPYDVLLLTERHDLMNVLLWEDTVRYVRHFHDRVTTHEPKAVTYLSHSWLGVTNLDDPKEWIAYERAAASAWECVADRINVSLAAEGKPQAIVPLPAGAALTVLVERALTGRVAGLKGPSARDTLKRIFTDDVHLTREAWHFIALVSFSSIYGRSPVGAAAPLGMNAALVRDLQTLAWELVSAHRAERKPREPKACRKLMRDAYCPAWARYQKRPNDLGSCTGAFAEEKRDGPFTYDAKTDGAYWLVAP